MSDRRISIEREYPSKVALVIANEDNFSDFVDYDERGIHDSVCEDSTFFGIRLFQQVAPQHFSSCICW